MDSGLLPVHPHHVGGTNDLAPVEVDANEHVPNLIRHRPSILDCPQDGVIVSLELLIDDRAVLVELILC